MIAADLQQHAVPIESLTTHPQNPRIGNVEAIMESLGRFGQVRPIVVQRSTGHIVAGNHTRKAAKALGWTEIAAVAIDLSDEDALAYLIADNRLADLGRYDMEILAQVMGTASGNLTGTGYDEDSAFDMMNDLPVVHPTELVPASELTAHPANYREHPVEQVAHITESLRQHGFYRNVVIANDGTVLAGHGLLAAAIEAGVRKVPVTRLPCGPNDPEALRVLAGDNELNKLGERDDRALSEMLREVAESGDAGALLGTGYDSATLANLVMVSRPEGEIQGYNAAAEWVGLPEFVAEPDRLRLVLAFDTEEQREELARRLELVIAKKNRGTWSAWWPPREQEDLASLRFQRGAASSDGEVAPEAVEATELVAEADTTPEPVAAGDSDNSGLGVSPVREPSGDPDGGFDDGPGGQQTQYDPAEVAAFDAAIPPIPDAEMMGSGSGGIDAIVDTSAVTGSPPPLGDDEAADAALDAIAREELRHPIEDHA